MILQYTSPSFKYRNRRASTDFLACTGTFLFYFWWIGTESNYVEVTDLVSDLYVLEL